MLKIEHIKKTFGSKEVLKDINLVVEKGEVYGLIGANGAGKTTLFNIIAQLLDYDNGEVIINDNKIKTINDLSHKLGYIIDIPALYDYMTAYEYLDYVYSPSGKKKDEIRKHSEKVLKDVGLTDIENKKIKEFSRGMKQRMGIAAGLIFEPDIILMDEPSSALDPIGRKDVLNIIQQLKSQGKTIILSTHILNDIERVCDRVGLLVGGKIVIEGNISDVLENYKDNTLQVVATNENKRSICELLKKSKLSNNFELKPSALEIKYKDNKNKNAIIKAIADSEIEFDEIGIKHKTIEEIFLVENEKGKK